MKWSHEEISRLVELLEDTRPLYLFMDEQEKVLDCQWFNSEVEAMNHARTLDASVVNILLYVGSAENKDESFFLEKSHT